MLFRSRVAEGTVVVDAGVAEVLVGEVAEAIDGVRDGLFAAGESLQEVAEPGLVDDPPRCGPDVGHAHTRRENASTNRLGGWDGGDVPRRGERW